jgi:HlyD family secretion protein
MNTKRTLPLLMLAGVIALSITVWQSQGSANDTARPVLKTTSLQSRVIAEGRVVTYPGAQMEIGAESGGLLIHLPIEENQIIEKGSVVAELRSDELRASLDEAKARVFELDAEQKLAEAEKMRQGKLSKEGAISEQDQERADRDLAVAQARRAFAVATVARIEAELTKTRIVAPFTATVLKRHVEPGEVINAHTSVATLADLKRLRIDAEVDEYDAGTVEKGAAVKITAEGFPETIWQGVVEEVPDVVVAKGMLPRDPARPVDVRVLRVKIAFSEKTPLKLGQRVEVEIAGKRSPTLAKQP